MPRRRHARPPREKPTIDRFFCALLLLCPALWIGDARAEAWSIEAARARALEVSRLTALDDATADEARAAGRAKLPWSNPYVGYQREELIGDAGEDFLWIGGQLDLSMRRGLYADAGDRRAAAAGHLAEHRRRALLAELERAFYAAVATEQRVAVHARWLARIEELLRVVRAREAAGDASRYDVLRVEREVARAHHHVDEARVDRDRLRAEVAAWLDDDAASLELLAELAPPPPVGQRAAGAAPEGRALREEAAALALESRAAGRWFLPPLSLTAGGKTATSPGRFTPGYILTLQIPIPIVERYDHQRAQLAAAGRRAEAEASLADRAAARRAASWRAAWAGALEALASHRAHATERSQALVKTARAAWGGGELSLLSLLEAERVNHDDELAAIALSARARAAQIEHAALTGGEP